MQLGRELARAGSVGLSDLLLAQQLLLIVRQGQVEVLVCAGCFNLWLSLCL